MNCKKTAVNCSIKKISEKSLWIQKPNALYNNRADQRHCIRSVEYFMKKQFGTLRKFLLSTEINVRLLQTVVKPNGQIFPLLPVTRAEYDQNSHGNYFCKAVLGLGSTLGQILI